MNIGIDFIIAACALFFIGIVLAMIFDSQLSEEDCMTNRKFSKWCFGIYAGIVLMIIGVVLLPVGVGLNIYCTM